MPKDNKRKIWEKERRDHLKEAFIKLEKLLPSYDPSSPSSRIDVLTKSIEYIQEMKNVVQELSKQQSEINPKVLKMKNLQDRIKRLVSRMEILSKLLREAKIPIPNARSWKDFNYKNYKWSGKINEQKFLAHKNMIKKKNETNDSGNLNSKRSNRETKGEPDSFSSVPKHRKNIVNNRVTNEVSSKQKSLQLATSNCVIIYTQAYNTAPCYLVTSAPSKLSGSSQTVITNSIVASNPVMTTNATGSGSRKAVTNSDSKMETLPAGTLILTNGSIYPVLPPPQPILPTPMIVQVTKNSNAMIIQSDIGKAEKKENIEQNTSKTPKKFNKKSPTKKSMISPTNAQNIMSENLIPQVCIKPKFSTNVLRCGPNLIVSESSSLLAAQINKIPISSSTYNYLKPKIPLVVKNKKKAIGRKLGLRPVSRKALEKIGNMTRKREMEEKKKAAKEFKSKKSSINDTNTVDKLIPQKDMSNIVISESKLDNGLNSIETKVVENTENISKSQKTISIIADDIVRESNHRVESVLGSEPEIAADSKDDNLVSKEEENIPPKKEGMENCVEEKPEKNLKESSSMTEMQSKTPQSEISPDVPNEQTELNQNTNTSRNEEITERLRGVDESENDNTLQVNQVQNDEHNLRSESNLDLENVCNMNTQLKNLDLHLGHSELSNDIFASLQVPPGCQNPESTSPTAAFLLAFPLVSSLTGVKVTEVMDEDNPDSQRETPTLLQIGNLDATKSVQSESFNPNLLNMDFFSSKDIYGGFYNSFEQHLSSLTALPSSNLSDSPKITEKSTSSSKFGDNFKTSNNMENSEISSNSKQTSINEHIFSTARNCGVPYNRNFSSSIDCQPNFTFDNQKLTNSVSTNEEPKDHIPHPISYLHKSASQNDSIKETHNIDETLNVHSEKSIKKIGTNQSLPQNVESDQFSKKSGTKVESSTENIRSSYIKREPCDNMFNIENINNNLSSIQQVNNMNFHQEKQKSLLSEDFNPQNSGTKNSNIQTLFHENIQNTQIPFTTNKNFISTSMQSNQVHTQFSVDNNISLVSKNMNSKNSSNYSQLNQQDSSSKPFIQPYFIPDNKNYLDISDQSNIKSFNIDGRNNETQKYFNYNNFDSENKKSLKNNEMSFDFNIEKKGTPVAKAIESKELPSSCNMAYSNTIYDINNITRVCTCAYSSNKPTSEPLYTNSNNNSNCNYYSNSESYLSEACYKIVRNDKSQVALNIEPYANYKKTDVNNAYYSDNMRKNNVASSKSQNHQEKSTYNWMTTPLKSTSDHIASNFPKDDMIYSNANIISSNQSSYFNPTSMYPAELNSNLSQTSKKTFDLSLGNTNYQKSEMEEGQNQFTWSPTKMPQFLDSVPSFVSSTLPTLVGDLALGSSNFNDQKYEYPNKFVKDTKNKVTNKMGYENQNNFFSVSQLVHQSDKTVPSKPTRRRNSGSTSKSNVMKNKKMVKSTEEQKIVSQCFNKSPGSQSNAKVDNKNFNCKQTNNNSFCDKRRTLKVSSSSYSAEALIGHQGQSESSSKKDQAFCGNTMKNISVPPYIPENIMPYFPPVELQQENLMQQNQNYQNFPNFTTFSNNTYSTNTFIPSSTITTPYISSTPFVSDIGIGNEFTSDNISLFHNTSVNKIKAAPKNNSGNSEVKNIHGSSCSNIAMKKVKKKSSNEINITSNLVDFPFLHVPGSINSPLLPDDFHSHSTFLPPPPTQPQLYPCKNSLYTPKQNTISSTTSLLPLPPIPVTRSGIQHPEISPSLNSVGNSLTNFNLSTIFPEITRSSISDIYSENQTKEQNTNRHYPNSSVPFNSKPTFTYPNGPITQPYGIDNR